jgi:hypothetical protein
MNLSSAKITTSDIDGIFKLPVSNGDTLICTSVGFEALKIVISDEIRYSEAPFVMKAGIVELDEVIIGLLPQHIEQFKSLVLETEVPADTTSFWYFGVDKPVFLGDRMVSERTNRKFFYALLQPTNWLHYKISKQEKEKRKAYELSKRQSRRERAARKLDRDWVAEETGLQGYQLTSFMDFCNYSPDYISNTPLYLIREDMLEKLKAFKGE